MDKLKLAHDYALKQIESLSENSTMQSLVSVAWQYADAMQAEADKRVNKERPDVLKEEWQPDWSQAPGKMNWFSIDKDGTAVWHMNKPTISATEWVIDCSDCGGDCYMYTSNFGYTGNWQDSLRKRPETKCEVDWSVAPSWAKYWAVRDGGYEALWCVNKPTVTDDCLLSHGGCSPAPSFGFTGTHIVERPNGF